MVRINLLPWREERRQQRQKDFISAIGLSIALVLAIFAAVHMHIEGFKDFQNIRNQTLLSEIAVLDNKITEIKEIEGKKNKLLVKIDLIQGLQESRPQIVHLFDEIAKRTPDGVYLTALRQAGKSLTLQGKAQSNARVSAFMREVENSDWLASPKLEIIRGMDKNDSAQKADSGSQFSDFTLTAEQSLPQTAKEPKEKKAQ